MQSSDETSCPGVVPDADSILTVSDIVQLLQPGVSAQTVRKYLRLPADHPDRLPGSKVGRGWFTTRSTLNAWLVRTH